MERKPTLEDATERDFRRFELKSGKTIKAQLTRAIKYEGRIIPEGTLVKIRGINKPEPLTVPELINGRELVSIELQVPGFTEPVYFSNLAGESLDSLRVVQSYTPGFGYTMLRAPEPEY